MTSLDVAATQVRDRAARVRPPSLATVIVTLIGLVPFVLGWVINAAWQAIRLVYAAFLRGWEVGETRLGPPPRTPGGS